MNNDSTITINKNFCKKICHKKYYFTTRKIVDNQIDNFFDIESSNFALPQHKYKVNDDVVLTNKHFLHGIGKNEKAIDFISKNGIISKEACGDLGKHAFEFVSGFWKVKEQIKLKDYILTYSGMDVRFDNRNFLVPYNGLDKFVEDMKNIDHWIWEGISSMEIRFMPSLARNINQYGFILNISSQHAQKLIKNDINSKDFNKKISKRFTKIYNNKKELKNHTFLNRASYIIFGLNKCFIEGILVGKNVEKNKTKLKELKQKFPNCYICNLNGKVIFE